MEVPAPLACEMWVKYKVLTTVSEHKSIGTESMVK